MLIRQHCHKEAAELLDEMLAREPKALHLRRTKIWAEMALHKDREALADVRSVAGVLAKQSPSELPAADAEDCATAGFLGRVFGFLEVPRENALPADELRSAKQYVLAGLGEERAEFDQSEEAVAEKFSKARTAFDEERAKRVAEGMTKQEAVAKQKKLIDETEASVDFDTEKVKTNIKTEVDRLNQAAQTINKNIMTCQFRLNVVRQAIGVNQTKLDMQNQNIVLTKERTPNAPFATTGQAFSQGQLVTLLQRLTAEQMLLTRQVNQLTEELRTTIAQRDALLDLGEKTTSELKTQAVALEARGETTRAGPAGRGQKDRRRAPKDSGLRNKRRSLRSNRFPLTSENQRVLGTADP